MLCVELLPFLPLMPSGGHFTLGNHNMSMYFADNHHSYFDRSSPHPSALARTHSISFVATGLVRSVVAATAGVVYAYGSSHNMTGLVWWIASGIAMIAWVMSQWGREENGHSIRLVGDEECRPG